MPVNPFLPNQTLSPEPGGPEAYTQFLNNVIIKWVIIKLLNDLTNQIIELKNKMSCSQL